ncbi:general stress protein CsbD [Fulvivirga sp. M361]|uniref:general stress protein CsbD n=1 Tax=Fulvivirga sp. M361 TaxID=2594266 RepID=UPI001194804D|nr:general stress protein CsbD [Fulvivirga sp. M361]TRX48589.1 general stress protein CsbD [Fulvivirga sp. M361]
MQIVRSWREQKILLKRIFPVINDEDFALEDKDRETMLDKLAAKLDKTRAQLELVFADLQRY